MSNFYEQYKEIKPWLHSDHETTVEKKAKPTKYPHRKKLDGKERHFVCLLQYIVS